ncbi:MAG: beta-lactamase family protein [Bryobacteraceae bacterium]|nr:beta-lactamase family protein [Bryobacteraceae bacterium]MDW8378710.1 serine hydrolase domain-containing protein [Bryobacterales bacterium]
MALTARCRFELVKATPWRRLLPLIVLLIVAAVFSCRALAQPADPHIRDIESRSRLAERMQELHVPAVSVAVIDEGRIAWAKAWGAANTDTVFQAASISKPVAAMAALHMSQYGNFGLDEDVNAKLKSWRVPENEFTANKKITLRRLLSHTAGLTVRGFPGYPSDGALPSLKEILSGVPPANTPPVVPDAEPGSEWRYSGGGYTVLQQLMVDRLGWSFPQIMERMVFSRLGMKRSTYEQPLPPAWHANAATGHDRNGSPVKGRWHVYPEMAAAGLWTTPSDLARWAIELREAYLGKSNRVIEPSTARQMLTRQQAAGKPTRWGLGVELHGDPPLAFSHGGSNVGFKCRLLLYLESGDGIVVMTNGDQGNQIVAEIMDAARALYHWPALPLASP